MYLFQKIEEASLNYHDARKNIATFLLEHRGAAVSFSMQEIAAETYTSKATLTRFAKGLGFTGWIDFMKAFLKECRDIESHYANINPNIPFTDQDNTNEMIRKLMVLQSEALKDTADLMDVKVIDAAAERIMKSNHIVLFGISPNNILAELFCRKMESIGKLCQVGDINEGSVIANALGSDDCAILISYSGNNPMRYPMRNVSLLKDNKVGIIAITGEGDNYLRREIDLVLTVSSRERLYSKIANYATEESINFILNVLYSRCFLMNFQKNYEYKVDNSHSFEAGRETNLSEMKESS